MTLREIGYSIKNRLEGFSPSDDSLLDEEYIFSRVNVARSDLVRKLDQQGQKIDDDFYQTICCLEIECEDLICDGIETDTRMIVNLPGIVSIKGGTKYFGTSDFKVGFQYVSNTGFLFNSSSQLASKKPYYTVIGSKAHVKNLPIGEMKYVCIIAVLDDPLNGGCTHLKADDEYPLPAAYIQDLEAIVIDSMMVSLGIFPDMANDGSSDARASAFNLYAQMQSARNKRKR